MTQITNHTFRERVPLNQYLLKWFKIIKRWSEDRVKDENKFKDKLWHLS